MASTPMMPPRASTIARRGWRPRRLAGAIIASGLGAAALAGFAIGAAGPRPAPPDEVAGMPVPAGAARPGARLVPGAPPTRPGARDPAAPDILWRLNNPAGVIIPESRANPIAVADKFAARVAAMEDRALLRAFEGAPPVIPHPIAGLNVETCRACHAQGLTAGDSVARMVSHTWLVACTQCHVEATSPIGDGAAMPGNDFVGLRASGYGGTRAWGGAPPVIPHTLFMRTNCVSCHGEHGYDGWRPDHLSRTNCVQCHTPAAGFEQLSPTFGQPEPSPWLRDALGALP